MASAQRIEVGRIGDKWLMTIAYGKSSNDGGPIGSIPISHAEISRRAQIGFDLPGAGGPIWWRDPETGSVLAIVTSPKPEHRFATPRTFVDFAVLRSQTGLVFRPFSEDLRFLFSRRRVVLRRPLGLNLSTGAALGTIDTTKLPAGPLAGIAGWRLGPTEDFFRNEAALTRRIYLTPPAGRNAARIALARFYLSHRRPAAAVGVVDVLHRQQPSEDDQLSVKALRGAANFLMGHYEQAHDDLTDEVLSLSKDAAPWIGALNAARGDWQGAHLKFRGTDEIIALQPPWLGDYFYLFAYEAALTTGNLAVADRYRRQLAHRRLGRANGERRAFLDGFYLKKTGEPRKAIVTWAPLRRSADRLVRARARMAVVEARHELGDIGLDQAIVGLEDLETAWRGDAFEFYLLNRLADLYFKRKRYRDGLSRLRKAASYFPKVEATKTVAETMRGQFRELYLNDGADAMPPVRALALFEEFRELTPPDSDGDKMVRKLAERLVDVDLLGRAAELLDHQVGFRLKGVDKAKVGARLAAIRLLDGAPDKALEALNKSATKATDEPAGLTLRRRHLMARALSGLGHHDRAVAAIGNGRKLRTERLRSVLLTRAGRWPEAAAALERSLAGKTIGKDDRQTAGAVLLWAVAAAMTDDRASLAALNARFGAAMAKTEYDTAFSALAETETAVATDYRSLVARTANLVPFQKVLDELKKQTAPTEPAAGPAKGR